MRIPSLDVPGQGAGRRNRRDELLRIFTLELECHVDAGDVGVAGDQPVVELGPLEGDRAHALQVALGQRGGSLHQILDDQVVADSFGVLKVGDRIDADR